MTQPARKPLQKPRARLTLRDLARHAGWKPWRLAASFSARAAKSRAIASAAASAAP